MCLRNSLLNSAGDIGFCTTSSIPASVHFACNLSSTRSPVTATMDSELLEEEEEDKESEEDGKDDDSDDDNDDDSEDKDDGNEEEEVESEGEDEDEEEEEKVRIVLVVVHPSRGDMTKSISTKQ